MAALAWVAGESSGDQIAGPVLAQLNHGATRYDHFGIGGPVMRAAGLQVVHDMDALSVRGYAEVLSALPRLLKMRRGFARHVIDRRPGAFVGVDAPDFNFALEARLRSAGVRTIHFVGPSVWAWRRERLKKIARAVDHMMLVFPFEKPLYDRAGIAATYVGHPMADQIDPGAIDRGAARARLDCSASATVVALLPGSRRSEIHYMAGLFVRTAAWLHRQRPDLSFLLPAASDELGGRIAGIVEALRRDGTVPPSLAIQVTQGHARDVLAAADTVLAASGTVTLEAALMQRPMVIAYCMSPVSYQLMKRMGYLPYVGLPNILCEDWVVPEFIQDAATPDAMGRALLAQLDDPGTREKIVSRFADLHATLAIGCAGRAAQVVAQQAEMAGGAA